MKKKKKTKKKIQFEFLTASKKRKFTKFIIYIHMCIKHDILKKRHISTHTKWERIKVKKKGKKRIINIIICFLCLTITQRSNWNEQILKQTKKINEQIFNILGNKKRGNSLSNKYKAIKPKKNHKNVFYSFSLNFSNYFSFKSTQIIARRHQI